MKNFFAQIPSIDMNVIDFDLDFYSQILDIALLVSHLELLQYLGRTVP